ncbi:DUF262 domain-containing protein [Mesorhizobium sp. 113-1-2]|uniref:DUF262 domain-containing protein n=1 Tax=Mesorhizobium sp. 113-1-2 TaxID=2744515 RepID=UPI00192602B8|nr:DUF262 domain-containing protein [Mesorhizobium sp. 113-1-2]
MQSTPLNASASTAGALFSNTTFEIPEFQREYAWGSDEVSEFWSDLQGSLDSDTYFLGLIILTNQGEGLNSRKDVVDGQQRIITLSLLATAIYHEALTRERKALAERIQADFLRSIDYESDATAPRVKLSDHADDLTFQSILSTGSGPANLLEDGSVSARMVESFEYLKSRLQQDLRSDPFKRLGRWTDFLTNKLYFAVFVHPDASTAYQVYEVINTRGKDLTTADLLKNYIISQAPPNQRSERYKDWRGISKQFTDEGSNNFVQYIRHVVTARSGYVLPKDLFGFLAGRITLSGKIPPTPPQLVGMLQNDLPLYLQMIDPTLGGPAEGSTLEIFSALNSLSVLAVRPILLATFGVPDALEGMKYALKLVVRRIVVGNLGTGNVERRLGEAAKSVYESNDWHVLIDALSDLNPEKDEFVDKLRSRSFNKQVLRFLRSSIIQKAIAPRTNGTLHLIWTRQSAVGAMSDEEGAAWSSTIGNTFLSDLERRDKTVTDWASFKQKMLPRAVNHEWVDRLGEIDEWDAQAVQTLGAELAQAAGDLWYS